VKEDQFEQSIKEALIKAGTPALKNEKKLEEKLILFIRSKKEKEDVSMKKHEHSSIGAGKLLTWSLAGAMAICLIASIIILPHKSTFVKPNPPLSGSSESDKAVGISEPERVNRLLSNDGTYVAVNANVVIPQAEYPLHTYKADYLEYDKDLIRKALLGNSTTVREDNYFEYTVGKRTSYLSFGSDKLTGFFEYGLEQGIVAYEPVPSAKHAAGCITTPEQALETANEMHKKLGFENFVLEKSEVVTIKYLDNRIEATGWGAYRITYVQKADGLSLGGAANILRFIINDKGIIEAFCSGYQLNEREAINSIMSLDSALNLVEEQLPSLWFPRSLNITKISLEYILYEDKGEIFSAPCWRLFSGRSIFDEFGLQKPDAGIGIDDLCVNAVTGQIFPYKPVAD
jgi:hypothetical protein